jgi:hypothetical protein
VGLEPREGAFPPRRSRRGGEAEEKKEEEEEKEGTETAATRAEKCGGACKMLLMRRWDLDGSHTLQVPHTCLPASKEWGAPLQGTLLHMRLLTGPGPALSAALTPTQQVPLQIPPNT